MTKLEEKHVTYVAVAAELGCSNRSIAAGLGVDESTIRYRLKRRRSGARDRRKDQPEIWSAYAEAVQAWIAAQPWEEGRPDSVRNLYDAMVAEHGEVGSYRALLRYVQRRSPRPKLRPKRRVETAPGAQVQIDWAQRWVNVLDLGGRALLHAFLMTLSHSRMPSLVWAQDETLLSWLRCHNYAFTFLGGVAATGRIDNLKTGVAKGGGPWAVLHKGYESYAKQLGFVVDPCLIGTPEHKGKVERKVRDITGGLLRNTDSFLSLADLQATTDGRIFDRARRRRCPVTGKSVYDTWQDEQALLKPLPQTLPQPFDVSVRREVGEDGLVSFEGRQYTVPFPWIRRTVEIRGCCGVVEIHGDGQILRRYPRHTECRLLVDQSCYDGPATDRVAAPLPLGKIGRAIVVDKSWTAPQRSIGRYATLIGGMQ